MRITYIIVFFTLAFYNTSMAQASFDNCALTGITIIDANHRAGLQRQTILISHHSIVNIFNDQQHPIPDSFVIINLNGKYVVPGLIDAHVHMATDPSGTDSRPYTLDILKKMLYTGVTTVRDMAGDARILAGLSRDALTGDIISPDIYYSALMAGPVFFDDPRTVVATRGGTAGKMPYMLAVTDTTNLVLAIAQAKGTGATGIKLYANLPASLVIKIVNEANKQGMIVWGHAWLQDAKPLDLINAGVSPISHTPLMLHQKLDTIPRSWKTQRHSSEFWDEVNPDLSFLFEQMKIHHTILDATLLTYKRWSEDDSSFIFDYELGKRITTQAYKAGVTIDAGTDDDQKEFVQREMELLVNEAGFSNIDAIIAGTLNGAKALHLDQSRGIISTNAIADLLILNKNPLDNIQNIESVYMVIKNGTVFKN